jgi:hypothetical protein
MEDHLNPELAGKFRIKNTHLPRVLNTPVGDIHFSRLTLDQAEKLVEADFFYLEKLPEAETDIPAAAGEPARVEAPEPVVAPESHFTPEGPGEQVVKS